MHNLNNQRFRQMPEYHEQMTQLKEEYPKVRSIDTKYNLLIYLTDIIIFVLFFIFADNILLVPSSIEKVRIVTIFALMLTIGIRRMVNLYLLDFKDEAIDNYVVKEMRKNEKQN